MSTPFRSLILATLAFALAGCDPGPLEPTYGNIAGIFDSSCSFSSCHGGTRAARLNFVAAREAGILYTDLLVSVPSCEYDRMPLIDPGHPENSWLYLKVSLEHAADGALIFTPAPDWDPGVPDDPRIGGLARSTCPLTEAPAMGEPRVLSFGDIMPDGSSNGLDPRRLTALRLWIEAGAPGPDGMPTPAFDAGMRDAPSRDVMVVDSPPMDVPPTDAPPADASPSDALAADAPDVP